MSTKIIVNGQEHEIDKYYVTYKEIIGLAQAQHGATVTFRQGGRLPLEGILATGEVVSIKDGMIFNAYDTGEA